MRADDSNSAAADKSSSVTKSTERSSQSPLVGSRERKKRLLTVVVGRILERRTRIAELAHVSWQISAASAENRPSARQQQDAGAHRQNLECRRLKRHDADSRAAPLPQVLDEEESVEDVHAVGRLVQHED